MEKNSKKKIRELTDAAYSLGLQPEQLVRRFRENKLDIFLQFYDGQTETLKSGTGVYEGQWEFPGVDNSGFGGCASDQTPDWVGNEATFLGHR